MSNNDFQACYKCSKRHVGCHSKCHDYLKEAANHQIEKESLPNYQVYSLACLAETCDFSRERSQTNSCIRRPPFNFSLIAICFML